MLSAGVWTKNQPNTILFVLVDSSGDEVTGLGSGYVLQLSKAGSAFVGSAGTKSEISNGWYKYVSTSGEADTSGPVAIKVTGAGIIQQNLEYIVGDRVLTALDFTYSVLDGATPIEGVDVLVYTDAGAVNFVWSGRTDAFGVARDSYGQLPRLDPGTYFLFSYKDSYIFNNPDSEVIS